MKQVDTFMLYLRILIYFSTVSHFYTPLKAYSPSYSLAPPISRVLIGQHLISDWSTMIGHQRAVTRL